MTSACFFTSPVIGNLLLQKPALHYRFKFSTHNAQTLINSRIGGRQHNTTVITCSVQLQETNLVLADIDPTVAKTSIGVLGPLLSAFGFLFIARIVMSWYPKLPVNKLPYVLAYAPTEPILRVTRKVIPPLGGVDVTPVVWFALVSFLSEILVGPQGLLVLLSQQIKQ